MTDGPAGYPAARATLLEAAHLRGLELCRALSDAADAWLAELLGDEPGVALVAVGGYGRGELAPHSDLDVVLVHGGRRDVEQLAQQLWYPVWDSGVRLDHSVRTLKEVLSVGTSNLETALGLLDARVVCGDESVAHGLAERATEQWRARARAGLAALEAYTRERHHRAGDVAFLLEPDLKEGRGGLRDVHAWRAAARASGAVGDEPAAVTGGYETLTEVRVALHRRLTRPSDLLALQEQDAVAADLGMTSADELMAKVSAAARAVGWATDEAFRRARSAREGPTNRRPSLDQPLAAGVVVRDGEVDLAAGADPRGDPGLALRAAAAAAQTGIPLAPAALQRLAADAPDLGDRWPDDARQSLVALLGAGEPAVDVLEALDQHGLLVRFLPEWESVRSRPQRSAYHRFTVDRHLCEAAVGAAALARRVGRPDLLLIGTLLHDIGKGDPSRDHTEVGIEIVQRVGPRMGFPPEDVDVLVAMVRHHLLLPDVATRRDLADPATARAVADAVGDHDTLDLLHALTEADSLATGPAAWSEWKAGLVTELARKAGELLAGRKVTAPARQPTTEQRRLLEEAGGQAVVRSTGETCTVVAPDAPGLFAAIAGTLALHGVEVLVADAWSGDGMAVDELRVTRRVGDGTDWASVEQDLRAVLSGLLPLERRLAERVRAYDVPGRGALAATPARADVLVDDDLSDSATVVEVRAPDGIAVLYRITRAMSSLGLDVRHAKVQTLGHEVVDSFYVVDGAGRKLGAEGAAEVRTAVLAALGG